METIDHDIEWRCYIKAAYDKETDKIYLWFFWNDPIEKPQALSTDQGTLESALVRIAELENILKSLWLTN